MKNERYPIGKFERPEKIDFAQIQEWIKDIESLPKQLKKAVKKMPKEALNMPYRDGGWTARQVIHHLADSHINSYVRFKWTLTEDEPVIKAYDEKSWADCEDSSSASVKMSLKLLSALHERWSVYLKTLSKEDFERGFIHPESNKRWELSWTTGVYAWHGKHHLAHIRQSVEKYKASLSS